MVIFCSAASGIDKLNQAWREYKHSLTFRVRRYVVIATQPVHRLQIHPNRAPPTIPPTYIWVRTVVWECGEGQTDRHTGTQTTVTNIHFASAIHLTRNVTKILTSLAVIPRLTRDAAIHTESGNYKIKENIIA